MSVRNGSQLTEVPWDLHLGIRVLRTHFLVSIRLRFGTKAGLEIQNSMVNHHDVVRVSPILSVHRIRHRIYCAPCLGIISVSDRVFFHLSMKFRFANFIVSGAVSLTFARAYASFRRKERSM